MLETKFACTCANSQISTMMIMKLKLTAASVLPKLHCNNFSSNHGIYDDDNSNTGILITILLLIIVLLLINIEIGMATLIAMITISMIIIVTVCQ